MQKGLFSEEAIRRGYDELDFGFCVKHPVYKYVNWDEKKCEPLCSECLAELGFTQSTTVRLTSSEDPHAQNI